jgi:hypothetical protein
VETWRKIRMTPHEVLQGVQYRHTVRTLGVFRVSKIPVYVSDTSIVRGGDVVYFVLLVSSANKNMVGGVKSRLHKRLSIVVSKLWNHRHRNIEQSNWQSLLWWQNEPSYQAYVSLKGCVTKL